MSLIIANWKHNPVHLSDALALAAATAAIQVPEGVEMVVCPPTTYIQTMHELYPGLVLGAQDVSALPAGPHTGEVGTDILKDLGVRYVIVGHSERRALGESTDAITAKAMAVVAAGMTPVLCVGEPIEVREQGTDAVHAFLQEQLESVPAREGTVVAYEPIWAIGSGTPADPATAGEVARWIAEYLGYIETKVRVLYGGSTSPENAAGFLNEKGIDGLLVGGASLAAQTFGGIVQAR